MRRYVLIGLIAVLAAAGLYCGYRYYDDVIRPEQELTAAEETQTALLDRIRPAAEEAPVPEDPAAPPEDPLAAAAAVNPAVVGWIRIPGTHIDHPIAQAADNDFYLHNGFDGEYNYELGCPFLDCRCASDLGGVNSIVYAHHMNKQRMFADIALYKDKSFLEAHPTGELTLHDGVHTVRFFAYLNVPHDHAVYGIADRAGEKAYLEALFASADYVTMTIGDLGREEDLHLLLLSTCTYEYQDARGVLAGIIE